MTTTTLSPSPVFRSWDNNGNPLAGGQLFTYAAGTTTPQTTYTDSTGNTANTNPVILNSRGEANVWLNPNLAYKFLLEDASNNQIWSVDNITSPIIQIPYGSASGTNTITVNTTPNFGTVSDGTTVVFKAANTNTGLSTLNANSTGAFNMYYADGVTQIIAGAIIQNNIYTAVFDSSLNSNAGGYIIQNPSRVNGSFTATLTGMTATTTGTMNYAINQNGRDFIVWAPNAITGTSNATTFTVTGVPNILVTTTSKAPSVVTEDSGVVTTIPTRLITGTANTWTLAVNTAGTGGFGTTGIKGFMAGFSFSSSLD